MSVKKFWRGRYRVSFKKICCVDAKYKWEHINKVGAFTLSVPGYAPSGESKSIVECFRVTETFETRELNTIT